MSTNGVVRHAADLPVESFADPDFGTVRWRTLFSSDRTATEGLTCGLASLAEGEFLALHRHAPPEVYFGVSGRLRVVVDGTSHDLVPGVAIYIPGNAVHGVFAEAGEGSFFYTFARDSFHEVEYNFLPDVVTEAPMAEAMAESSLPIHPALDQLDIVGDDAPPPN